MPTQATNIQYSGLPTHKAIRHLIDHLNESAKALGYKPPKEPAVEELMDEKNVYGHRLFLPAPQEGFTESQREKIESYAQALTYWGGFMAEFQFSEKSLTVTFRRSNVGDEEPDEDDSEEDDRLSLRDRLAPKGFRVARNAGKALIEQGFKVREPVAASLVTMTHKVVGYAILIRYPSNRYEDKIGITQVYDRVVPMVADAFARDNSMKADAVKDGEFTTLFFTSDRSYSSSMYDPTATFRMIVPRPAALTGVDFAFFARSTYRASKSLMNRYKKDFRMLKRPVASMHGSGHSVVLNYQAGAQGQVVDEAYALSVSKMTRVIMKKYKLQATLTHQPETRMIVVTFYSALEGPSSSNRV